MQIDFVKGQSLTRSLYAQMPAERKGLELKLLWGVAVGTAVTAVLVAVLRNLKAVFDNVRRTDKDGKFRTESSYAYLNRSARRGSAECRALIETWMKRVPGAERAVLRSRFRSGDE